ncbi:MAG: methyltransferase domain-containing protein [Proteobacteria bacterium]|nr:methyltransferase domain-containing protein [Pseudomonadota bacterium]
MKGRVRATINHCFSRSDHQIFLYDEVAKRLDARLEILRLEPKLILVSGFGAHGLKKRFPSNPQLIGFDFAHSRLATRRLSVGFRFPWMARQLHVCGDLSALPFASASADMVYSNLDLPFFFECDELTQALAEVHRILKPGGLFIFSSLGPDTLKELKRPDHKRGFRLCAHLDMHDLGDQLMAASFSDPVVEMEELTLTYGDALSMMRDIRAHGSVALKTSPKAGLLGADAIRYLAEQSSAAESGRLTATCELVLGHAWRVPTRTSHKGQKVIDIKMSTF